MRALLLLSPLLLAVAPPFQAPTGFLNAGELQDKCSSNAPGPASYCYAYITGVFDTMRAYEAWLNLREFCVPDKTAQGDLRRAFLAYLAVNPGVTKGEAASVVAVALKQRYPCDLTPPRKP
jgi:hypothetical protein